MSLDYKGKNGVATSIGHSPILSLIDSSIGSRSSIAEALTNIVFVPLKDALNLFHYQLIGCGQQIMIQKSQIISSR